MLFSFQFDNLIFGCFWRQSYENITCKRKTSYRKSRNYSDEVTKYEVAKICNESCLHQIVLNFITKNIIGPKQSSVELIYYQCQFAVQSITCYILP
jgi:hypothetical protein